MMPTTRFAMRLIAPVLLLAVIAGPAAAGPPDRVPGAVDFFYGDFEADVLLFAGQQPEDFCTGEVPTPTTLKAVHRGDGSTLLLGTDRDVPLYLYASPLGAPELIETTCSALLDDDPSTGPAAPFATGTGVVVQRTVLAGDGSAQVWNQTVGQARSEDGGRWTVRGSADLVVVDGVPVGDPEEFQGLRVRPAPRLG